MHTSRASVIKYDFLSKYRFDVVLIYEGINDLWANHVTPERFRDDYVLVKAVAISLEANPQTDPAFDFLRWKPTVSAAQQAYAQAGISNPFAQLDVAQVHDCFTLTEMLTYEDLGFCEKGCGGPAAEEGRTAIDGKTPLNTSGGLKSKGHPVGATGIAQIIELYEQLTGQAGKRQIKNAHIGLAQNMGGTGASCVINILEAK